MESFDVKLLELLNGLVPLPDTIEACKSDSIQNYVYDRTKKILDKYFIYVRAMPHDPESSSCYVQRLVMYSVLSGKSVKVDYSGEEKCYMLDNKFRVSWNNIFVTEKEAIDSVTKKKGK